METVLFLSHTEPDGALGRPALEALEAATRLASSLEGSRLVVGLFGDAVKPAADAIAGCGAARFVAVESEELARGRYATDAAAAETLCRAAEATLVIAPGTSRCARIAAGLSSRLGGRVDTHATSIEPSEGSVAVTRWFYRQRMEGVLRTAVRPWVVTVDSGFHPAWSGPVGSASVERLDVTLPACRTTVTGTSAPETDEQTIRPEAEVLLVAGAGWTKKQADGAVHFEDAAEAILGLLRVTKGSLGSSKSLVDLGGEGQTVLPFLSHLNQVGQTGSTPRHPKGLSTCCHGEEPHVVGWRFIKERRAIDLDASCGWARGKADVLYVADAFEVIPKVTKLLEERSKGG